MRTIILSVLFQLIITVSLIAQEEWIVQESPTENDLYSVDFINDYKGIAVGKEGTILKTIDGGTTWQKITTSFTNNLRGICFYDENHAVAVGTGGQIIVTENGGNTWTTHWLPGIQWDLYAVDITPDGIGIASGQQSTILYTTNGGLNWSVIQEQIPGFCNAVRRYNDSITYVFGAGVGPFRIHKLVNNTIADLYEYHIDYQSYNWEGSVYDGYAFNETSLVTVGKIFRFPSLLGSITVNQDLDSPLWESCVIMDSVEFRGIDFIGNYGITVGGIMELQPEKSIILETSDAGISWESTYIDDKLPNLKDVKMIGNVAYAVGNSGVILKKVTGTHSASADLNENGLTVYPNPSTGDSRITFTLEKPENVCITVFDMNGRLINTPFKGSLGAGIHHVVNPLTSVPGYCPAPGLYLIRLAAGSKVNTAKFMIR